MDKLLYLINVVCEVAYCMALQYEPYGDSVCSIAKMAKI